MRLAILQNLTALPAGIWKEPHLIEIAGFVRQGGSTRPISHASVLFLSKFVQKLIPTHPQWAANQLVIIYRERGYVRSYAFESRINDQLALTLENAFLEVGKDWGRGNRVNWLYLFAAALGKRLGFTLDC